MDLVLVFLLAYVLGSEDDHIPSFWLLNASFFGAGLPEQVTARLGTGSVVKLLYIQPSSPLIRILTPMQPQKGPHNLQKQPYNPIQSPRCIGRP